MSALTDITKVTERPMLFNGPMVRAVLAGSKTQTRRVLKDLKGDVNLDCNEHGEWFTWWDCVDENGHHYNDMKFLPPCPYGKVGDRLWVRETWYDNEQRTENRDAIFYRADGEFSDHFPEDYMEGKWSPSIHMFRWMSRITLEVTGVRVERVGDITSDDAFAEGIQKYEGVEPGDHDGMANWDPVRCFEKLWDSINGKSDGKRWADNPWVWCISFKRVT